MNLLLTVILAALLLAIMMATVACDEVRTLRRRILADEERLDQLEARLSGLELPRLSVIPAQRDAG